MKYMTQLLVHWQELKTRLENEKPDLLGIYTNLMTKLNVLKIIRFIKDSPILQHTKIILGGPEVRNHKEKIFRLWRRYNCIWRRVRNDA
jgi:hypothetical protein